MVKWVTFDAACYSDSDVGLFAIICKQFPVKEDAFIRQDNIAQAFYSSWYNGRYLTPNTTLFTMMCVLCKQYDMWNLSSAHLLRRVTHLCSTCSSTSMNLILSLYSKYYYRRDLIWLCCLLYSWRTPSAVQSSCKTNNRRKEASPFLQ